MSDSKLLINNVEYMYEYKCKFRPNGVRISLRTV